jgi:hypothetical protein
VHLRENVAASAVTLSAAEQLDVEALFPAHTAVGATFR